MKRSPVAVIAAMLWVSAFVVLATTKEKKVDQKPKDEVYSRKNVDGQDCVFLKTKEAPDGLWAPVVKSDHSPRAESFIVLELREDKSLTDHFFYVLHKSGKVTQTRFAKPGELLEDVLNSTKD